MYVIAALGLYQRISKELYRTDIFSFLKHDSRVHEKKLAHNSLMRYTLITATSYYRINFGHVQYKYKRRLNYPSKITFEKAGVAQSRRNQKT